MEPRYAVIPALLGQIRDRFAVYNEDRSLAQRLELAAQVAGLRGVELVYPFELQDIDDVKALLKARELECSAVNVNLKSSREFHRGSLTSSDPRVRAQAVRYLKNAMDIAAELGCFMITVCPLADGHDYPFESDYAEAWRSLREGVADAAQYRPDVRVSLEYKRSEARTHVILSTAGVALHLCDQIGLPNVGVTLDMGHALYALETPAQAVALLAEAGRLFLVHINDNYRDSDWDMIPGTVNFWDMLETMLYLDAVGYEGWLTSDVFPARLDPLRVANMTIESVRTALCLLEKMGTEELWGLIREGDALSTFAHLQARL